MEKAIRIVKKGEDESNVLYWQSLNNIKRLEELETIRQTYNQTKYGSRQGLQRVYRITKRP